ncbi:MULTISPECIES: lipoyl synthase [unclassified Pseudodesulfovibrio]|uniref:lipoyl synthase n=1 Tax=unclassified Pseudodesulfovibrio TaxID=2661612 RepID=UPI000FEB8A3A|nr:MULTISPECIES: lipoyl synthase [unclassified Pseudodesulfovibrio]MCJ2162995.1 lipoyl synthase [Pseudodesulfovibrio sp. S3-i]RWU06992.1 lipoyl synthase [Pseudodesulfovibrio sp. S3]
MSLKKPSEKPLRIPPWLRIKLPNNENFACTSGLISDLNLNTVCQSAKCPNKWECFSKNVATFLIMGSICTRNCAFCNIVSGDLDPLDPSEPGRVAEAAKRLKLKHVVITSVTRDDLADGGSAHFAATIRAVRAAMPECTIEVLIPDFQGNEAALRTVLDARPDVLNHNLETVPVLYADIRPQADYRQSLELLANAKRIAPKIPTKSGIMVGLGETDEQIMVTLDDLAAVDCNIVTIGQYMQPSRQHPMVKRYVEPATFDWYAEEGMKRGIGHMFSAPLVRSSYNAADFV